MSALPAGWTLEMEATAKGVRWNIKNDWGLIIISRLLDTTSRSRAQMLLQDVIAPLAALAAEGKRSKRNS